MVIALLGGSSAIAHHTAREFARREHARFLLVGRNAARLDTVAADLRAFGAESAATMVLDFTDPAQAGAWLEECERVCGSRPDLVVIAHGSLSDESQAASDPLYATAEVETNFTSTVRLAYAAAADFRAHRRGQLAIITSVAGVRGRASNFFYGSAKAGLIAFCSGLRALLSREGIVLTELRPGTVATPMTAHLARGFLTCDAARAGALCAQAIRAKRDIAYIPGVWRWIMLVIRLLPERVFKQVKF